MHKVDGVLVGGIETPSQAVGWSPWEEHLERVRAERAEAIGRARQAIRPPRPEVGLVNHGALVHEDRRRAETEADEAARAKLAQVSPWTRVLAWETEGVESIDEAIEVARAILELGLHRSAGRYGRFVRDVVEAVGPEALGLEGVQS